MFFNRLRVSICGAEVIIIFELLVVMFNVVLLFFSLNCCIFRGMVFCSLLRVFGVLFWILR